MPETGKKIAIITGSGRGIGRGIAIQLARQGWKIVINDVGNPEPPQENSWSCNASGNYGVAKRAKQDSAYPHSTLICDRAEGVMGPSLLVDMNLVQRQQLSHIRTAIIRQNQVKPGRVVSASYEVGYSSGKHLLLQPDLIGNPTGITLPCSASLFLRKPGATSIGKHYRLAPTLHGLMQWIS